MKIQSLRSPYTKVHGICFFARMIDKIRLNAQRLLPPEYVPMLGGGFDGKTCHFLLIKYEDFVPRVLQGGSDEELLQWAFQKGRRPDHEEIEIWNEWMRKYGWNDQGTKRLRERLSESGFEDRHDIQTVFDYIDLDEGRDPRQR
jgi:uncharacterized protein DUF5069